VLNINALANAVRAIYLPGEDLTIRIIQEGKERGQGVGYLEDGTMVVVEDGERHIDREVDTVVTKVLQTAAGRMIFRPHSRGLESLSHRVPWHRVTSQPAPVAAGAARSSRLEARPSQNLE
jgi:hypothetical protein